MWGWRSKLANSFQIHSCKLINERSTNQNSRHHRRSWFRCTKQRKLAARLQVSWSEGRMTSYNKQREGGQTFWFWFCWDCTKIGFGRTLLSMFCKYGSILSFSISFICRLSLISQIVAPDIGFFNQLPKQTARYEKKQTVLSCSTNMDMINKIPSLRATLLPTAHPISCQQFLAVH